MGVLWESFGGPLGLLGTSPTSASTLEASTQAKAQPEASMPELCESENTRGRNCFAALNQSDWQPCHSLFRLATIHPHYAAFNQFDWQPCQSLFKHDALHPHYAASNQFAWQPRHAFFKRAILHQHSAAWNQFGWQPCQLVLRHATRHP